MMKMVVMKMVMLMFAVCSYTHFNTLTQQNTLRFQKIVLFCFVTRLTFIGGCYYSNVSTLAFPRYRANESVVVMVTTDIRNRGIRGGLMVTGLRRNSPKC